MRDLFQQQVAQQSFGRSPHLLNPFPRLLGHMAALLPPAPLVPDFNGHSFLDKDRPAKLVELAARWAEIRSAPDNTEAHPRLDVDPILSPATEEDREALLKRYLIAEDFNVGKAATRLESTLRFRGQFRVLDFYDKAAEDVMDENRTLLQALA